MTNPILEVQKLGQSIWLDNLSRKLVASGELARMVREEGLVGITSNPAIFAKSVGAAVEYDAEIRELAGTCTAKDIYERLAVADIQSAADVLRPVYDRTGGRDGLVSLEVSPYLAWDTPGTIAEARRLWSAVGRPNVMIKVPGTPAGMPAIEQLISEGINVNVTLLFAVEAYLEAARAYTAGLEKLLAGGADPSRVSSVASFFVSRIDTLIDERIDRALAEERTRGQALSAGPNPDRRSKLDALRGVIAIANAKIAYVRYQEWTASSRWKKLQDRGARTQRLLWASTSTKNPSYSKTLYVDNLVGPDTVNTIPAETWQEYRTNGRAELTLTRGAAQAESTMRALGEVGISMKEATDALLLDGVEKFSAAFDTLLAAVERKRQGTESGLARQAVAPGELKAALEDELQGWRSQGKIRRLYAGDATLWSGTDEGRWLGWLGVLSDRAGRESELRQLVSDARDSRFGYVLLLGMGGSSLCPWVLRRTFGILPNHPELVVLDSVVPAQVRAIEKTVDLTRTLFLVSSKSGTTVEPDVLFRYFFSRVREASRFIAITDPGTPLAVSAAKGGFRRVILGDPSIGGRFSALSSFGTVPAALMGLDPAKFLERARVMARASAWCVPPETNPGVALGATIGKAAERGRDKITFILSPPIQAFGSWVEQLLAESTGKSGRGAIPIDGEEPGAPQVYGNDRLFVYLRLSPGASDRQDRAVEDLQRAGYPVVRIELSDPLDLAQEFFRWEIATAVAGSVLKINAFNQPDVEVAKGAARALVEEYEKSGTLPAEKQGVLEDGLSLAGGTGNGGMRAHLDSLRPGDYFSILAYLPMSDEIDRRLQALRHAVRDAKRTATTVGYGPRYLHSTGQLHKGGPNTGVFLLITADDESDLAIPGRNYSFGILARAQAQGDFRVLSQRGRRVVRVHLGANVSDGLGRLENLVRRAL